MKYEYDDNLKALYKSTKKEPFFVNVPCMNYITYNGTGHPNGDDFQASCEALFTLSYIIKFKIIKRNRNIDYKVNPLEVSWYLDKGKNGISFTWTAMIMQPEFVDINDYNEAINLARKSKKDLNYQKVKFECIDFRTCIQCFHLGDYNNMNDTMYKMQDLARISNMNYDLYTHDIYLNDPRKTKKENLKSIMRIRVYNKKEENSNEGQKNNNINNRNSNFLNRNDNGISI